MSNDHQNYRHFIGFYKGPFRETRVYYVNEELMDSDGPIRIERNMLDDENCEAWTGLTEENQRFVRKVFTHGSTLHVTLYRDCVNVARETTYYLEYTALLSEAFIERFGWNPDETYHCFIDTFQELTGRRIIGLLDDI